MNISSWDWEKIRSWGSLVLSFIGSGFLVRNYFGEKKKRRLALMPFFSLSTTKYEQPKTIAEYANFMHVLILVNVGDTAIVKKIINELDTSDHVNVYKIAYAKGSNLEIETFLKKVSDGINTYTARYNHTIYFEDIEGRLYMQNVKFVNKKHYETVPIEVDVIP